MKIGILTLPLHSNYGGILQAYALQSILERMGHEVIVVDKDNSRQEDFLHQVYSILRYIRYGFNHSFIPNKSFNKRKALRESNTRHFINEYIHLYPVNKMVKDFPRDVDAIVVGSDQIWRKKYFLWKVDGDICNAFLKFTTDWVIKRIAYAASFGTDDWEYTEAETSACADLIANFDAVSVRELSGVDLCREKLNRSDVMCVLDPTMLLNKDDYLKLVGGNKQKEEAHTLLVYVLDETEEKQGLVNRIAQERGLTPLYANQPNKSKAQPSVEHWLKGFRDSDFVITDSFHACVFSIIFGKPFIAIGNKDRGLSRFQTLLSMFNMIDHLIFSPDGYNSCYDYAISEESSIIIAEKQKASLNYLFNALQ